MTQCTLEYVQSNHLMDAVRFGSTNTVLALLAAGYRVLEDDYPALTWKLGERLITEAAFGHTDVVQAFLAAGALVDVDDEAALTSAVCNNHTKAVKLLLAAGADVHAKNDYALRMTAENGRIEMMSALARHIFTPDSWRGKSYAEIEIETNALCSKIETFTQPNDLRQAANILIDCALTCWEQVRPAPPKIQISPLPAQPRPL